jgi:hypothetical protein
MQRLRRDVVRRDSGLDYEVAARLEDAHQTLPVRSPAAAACRETVPC